MERSELFEVLSADHQAEKAAGSGDVDDFMSSLALLEESAQKK